jgi:outer membrane lipoprotein-sorting protein
MAFLLLLLAIPNLRAADTNAFLESWLAAQASLKTWSADCVQTRALPTLTTPLVATGKVWFAAPDRFRLELGQPVRTIALRRGDTLWIIYPKLKRAERYELGGSAAGPWRDALALLDAGFPQSRAQIDKQFRVASLLTTHGTHELALQPTSGMARRFITQVGVTVSTNACVLLATELTFADGSRMRNDFTHIVTNPPLDASRFEPSLGADFTITEPLKP